MFNLIKQLKKTFEDNYQSNNYEFYFEIGKLEFYVSDSKNNRIGYLDDIEYYTPEKYKFIVDDIKNSIKES